MEGAEASSHVTTADYDAQGLKMAFYRKLDHLSQMQAVSGMDALHDAAYTVTDGNQSGLQSVAYAMQVIRDGRESAMIATGTDENDAILPALYHGLGLAAAEPVVP